ncbi:O-methylsterigmatocystin oxidoreductase [Epithele typhae]|uniref:O-methylsterigmatocystin oxidoreductase n=1 Tax=Epithele typhae TaxID=378194 RepID=UPI0020087B95|nr:O-methylsterigmatocystin oxidoreductase [Epithele typhae]KAH9912862.1 O-methylsterigmatocystin oxidoreductase [Epithele typhae]
MQGYSNLFQPHSPLRAAYFRIRAAWRTRTKGRPLPPSPNPLPIIGNMLDMPTKKPWVGFRELCARYGDVVHLQVFGQHMIVLDSAEAITEFLEKRTNNTSDRLIGVDWLVGLLPYGDMWRKYRRAFWQYFHPNAVSAYRPVQLAVTRKFLVKLLRDPSDFKQLTRFSFSATILKVGYGIDIDDPDHPLIRVIDDALEGTAQTFIPGRYLVDTFPALEYLPSWIPGAGFQKLFAKWKEATSMLLRMPYEQRNEAFTEDVVPYDQASILDSLSARIQAEDGDAKLSQEQEALVQKVLGVAFEAAIFPTEHVEKTIGSVYAAFLAMSLFPEVQNRAQAELDAVVGPHRLPTFEDRDKLVYVNALIKESLRWHNITPLSIAHRTNVDDEFCGYFVPAGTVLVANVWSCMHDPIVYPDPDEFRPERFIRDGKLDPDVRDPMNYAFGFGRRICPGRHFADAGLFLNVVSVLHVFNIGPPVDSAGNPIKVVPSQSDGFLSYPEDCRCTFTPRSAQASALILGGGTADGH